MDSCILPDGQNPCACWDPATTHTGVTMNLTKCLSCGTVLASKPKARNPIDVGPGDVWQPAETGDRLHPIGVLPRWRWLEMRQVDLLNAMKRYTAPSANVKREVKSARIAEWSNEVSRISAELGAIKS